MRSLWSRPTAGFVMLVLALTVLFTCACSSSGGSPSSSAGVPSPAAVPSPGSASALAPASAPASAASSVSAAASCAQLGPDLDALGSTLTSEDTSVSDKAQAVRTALTQLLPALRTAASSLGDQLRAIVRDLGALATTLADPHRSSASLSSAVRAVTDDARTLKARCGGSGAPAPSSPTTS